MPFTSETGKEAKAKAKGRGEARLTKLIKAAADKDKAIKVFAQLEDLALKGDMDAIRLYLSYIIGKPKETVQHEGNPLLPVIFRMDGRFSDNN